MNHINTAVFQLIRTSAESLKESITASLQKYRKEVAEAAEESERYKDENGYLASRKHFFAELARGEIEKTQRIFQDKLSRYAETLTGELEKHVSTPLNGSFRDQLLTIAQFKIRPSRTQIEALLKINDGHPVGLQALTKVLSDVGSEFQIISKPIADYERDIKYIEQLAIQPISYDILYHHEAVEILSGTNIVQVRPDGRTFENGMTFDSTSLLAATSGFENAVDRIEGMGSSWAADVTYRSADEMSDHGPDRNVESSVSIEESDTQAVEIAKELGRQKAAQNRDILTDLQKAAEML